MQFVEKIVLIAREIGAEIWSAGAVYMLLLTLAAWLFFRFAPARPTLFADGVDGSKRDRVLLPAAGALALAAYALYAAVYGLPLPAVHDENCYLLMAKTFAAGRLTNPPHELWPFFEHFHLLPQPTYTAKYPPAQGLFLAFGLLVFQHAIAGVWLSGALAVSACYWSLRALFAPGWAFFGALLLLTQPTVFGWSQSYWGGNVALGGAFLCVGAVFRLTRAISVRHAVALALGAAVLANSRPFEGVLLLVPLGGALLYAAARRFGAAGFRRDFLLRLILPAGLVLAANFLWMGFYNWRVTGDAFVLPYSLYTRRHDPVPLFLPFSEPNRAAANRHRVIQVFYENELALHYEPLRRSAAHGTLPAVMAKRALNGAITFLSESFLLDAALLLVGVFALRERPKWLFFAAAGLFCLYLEAAATYNQNHYFAPFVPLLIVAVTAPLVLLTRRTRDERRKRWLRALPPALVAAQLVWTFALHGHFKPALPDPLNSQIGVGRALAEIPGRHLVVVDYSTGDLASNNGRYNRLTVMSWVYNEPAIDDAPIVWANDIGAAENRRLFDYYPERNVWILGFDAAGRGRLWSCRGRASPFPPDEELAVKLQARCPAR